MSISELPFFTFSDGILAHVWLWLIIHVIGVPLVNPVVMHPQVPPVSEPLPTLCAGKGPLPHVHIPLVSPQVPAAGKALATLGAAERPLARVRASVHGELGGSEEALVAELTGVQSDSCVA